MHIYVGFEVFAFTYLGGSKSTSPALTRCFPLLLTTSSPCISTDSKIAVQSHRAWTPSDVEEAQKLKEYSANFPDADCSSQLSPLSVVHTDKIDHRLSLCC